MLVSYGSWGYPWTAIVLMLKLQVISYGFMHVHICLLLLLNLGPLLVGVLGFSWYTVWWCYKHSSSRSALVSSFLFGTFVVYLVEDVYDSSMDFPGKKLEACKACFFRSKMMVGIATSFALRMMWQDFHLILAIKSVFSFQTAWYFKLFNSFETCVSIILATQKHNKIIILLLKYVTWRCL